MRLKTFESFNAMKVNEAKTNDTFVDDVRKQFPEQADNIINIISQSSNNLKDVNITLEKINKLIDGNGVENFRVDEPQYGFLNDIVMKYIDIDDGIDNITIMYDINTNMFLCTSHRNWIKINKKKYKL